MKSTRHQNGGCASVSGFTGFVVSCRQIREDSESTAPAEDEREQTD
jgi:hypothetical protein